MVVVVGVSCSIVHHDMLISEGRTHMQIRDATADDLPAIVEIYNAAIRETTAVYADDPETLADRRTWWHDRTVRGFPILVAADETGVLGFASFGEFRDRPGYRFTVEHSIFLAANARGRGIGEALMTPLCERAAALGMHAMVGGIDSENTPAIKFHDKMGFDHAGTLKEVACKFDRWLNLVFMVKRLDSPE